MVAHIKAKHEETCKTYTAHGVLDKASLVYRLVRLLECGFQKLIDNDRAIRQAEQNKNVQGAKESKEFVELLANLQFRHLFDHLALAVQRLFMPQDKWAAFDKVASDALNKEAEIETLRRTGVIKNPQDYWMMHIQNDLEMIAGTLNLEPKTKVLEWLRAAMSHMGEMIITNQAEDPATKLFLNRALFPSDQKPQQADQVVCDQKEASLKRTELSPSARAALSFISLHLLNIPPEMADKSQLQLFSKLFRVNPPSIKDVNFLDKLQNLMKEPHLKIIEIVSKYQPLLTKLPEMLNPLIEICRLVQQDFSGKITLKEAMDSKILDSPLCKEKTKLKDLFQKLKVAATQILNFSKGEYDEIFKFAIGCQRDIDNIDEILKQVTSDDATLFYFILGSGSEEMFKHQAALKAIIVTFIHKLHNMTSLACIDPYGDDDADGQTPAPKKKAHVLSIKNSTYADYIYLPTNINLPKLVEENTSFDPENNMEMVIDTLKIKQYLSRLLYKPQIQAEPGDFDEFVYCDRVNMSGISREIRRFFNYATVEEIGVPGTKIIKDDKSLRDQNDVEAYLKNLIDLISSTCRYLSTGLKFSSFKEKLLLVVEDCSHEPETKDRLKPALKQAIDQLGLSQDLTVGELLPLFEELKVISYDTFVPSKCSKSLGENKEKVVTLIKNLKPEAINDAKCTRLIESVKDQVFEYILSGYPSTSHLQAKIMDVGVDIDPIEEEIEKTEDPEEKKRQTEFLSNFKLLLDAIKYEQWGSIQEYFK